MARPVGGKLGCHDANHDTQGGWRPGRSFPEQKWEWTNICVFVHLLASQEKKNTSLTKVTFICFLSSPRALHADLCQMLSKSYLYQRIPCAWKIFFPINSLLIVKAAVLSIINLSSLLPLLCVLHRLLSLIRAEPEEVERLGATQTYQQLLWFEFVLSEKIFL